MKLVIVESPSKSKTISKYLGEGFVVRASVGHIRDLPKSSKKAIDIEGGFIPHYEVVPKKQEVIDDITAFARKADEIILATDPDREGEAIAWHISEVLKDSLGKDVKKKMERISFHEITKEAVNDALAHPRQIDQHLREAQEARRVLDRLVGYDLSGVIWKKVRYGLSAGRVQSPALRIIMEREREIRAFKPETYWAISGRFETAAKAPLTLTCSVEPRDRAEVDRILAAAQKEKWSVTDIEESEQKRSPRAPFITSTLQQTASTRFGFTPSRTMGIAQKLYESGHITYMRTDSTNLGQQALDQIGAAVKKNYGEKYLLFRKYTAKSKNAQEAHEAIRPSHFDKENAGLNDEQKKLYRLIWQRAVASQMADAVMARTKISANVESASVPVFEANGSRVLFDGWLKADPESVGEDVNLPKCAKGEKLTLASADAIVADEKQTQPPPRYTEAGLIKELEKRGIGRPSTYASICKTIEDRGYVEKENKSLRPTDTGDVVSSFLEENFPTYISDTFTADMEDKLDGIADGSQEYVKILSDFYTPFQKEVKSKDKLAKATHLGVADPKFKCPKCGTTPMEIKLGRNGKFLSCSRYPDCDGALTLDGMEFKKDSPIGNDPTTGLPIFVLNGRFGPYVQLGVKPEKKKAPKKRKTKAEKEADKIALEKGIAIPEAAPEEPAVPAQPKPRMASIPKTVDPSLLTVTEALKYLSVPRKLGIDPATGKEVTASIGRFGPYVVRDADFRSIKAPDDVYTITLERALAMLAVPKQARGFKKKAPKS
ncbi:MAG: topoisomerase topoisomerase protein [Candidatus Parcubacteria bacterium]|nr:topoisomerase topoisomerase protein [Candidatus Parcubacteria bacterium]